MRPNVRIECPVHGEQLYEWVDDTTKGLIGLSSWGLCRWIVGWEDVGPDGIAGVRAITGMEWQDDVWNVFEMNIALVHRLDARLEDGPIRIGSDQLLGKPEGTTRGPASPGPDSRYRERRPIWATEYKTGTQDTGGCRAQPSAAAPGEAPLSARAASRA